MQVLKFFVVLFITIVFCACNAGGGGGNSAGDPAITAMEQELGTEAATPEQKMELLNLYNGYIQQNPEGVATATYLLRAAKLQYELNRFGAAEELLKARLRNFPEAEGNAEAALLLGEIYGQKMQKPQLANVVYKNLTNRYPSTTQAVEAKGRINGVGTTISEDIANIGNQMFNDSLQRMDFRAANDYIAATELYAIMNPGAADAPELLLKGAETARSVRNFQRALSMYEMVSTEYGNSPKAGQALFMRAFTLDNDLKRYDEARTLYEQFLEAYPNDEFADDTRFLLENLGKSDEEIINSFTKKDAG